MQGLLQLGKRRDGAVALTIRRADGSSTGKRYEGKHARFFAVHDLTHWVVERSLRSRHGFFGLVLGGMDIETFGAPESKGVRLPDEAIAIEVLIGLLETVRTGRGDWRADELHGFLQQACAQRGVQPLPDLAEGRLRELRLAIDEQVTVWDALPPGETLQLPIDW